MKNPRIALGAALTLAAAFGATRADELIRFKSGYEMMVVNHREEGDMVFVTLDGGGEVGFRRDIIEVLEGGKATTRTGGSPMWNKVPSRVHVNKFVGRPQPYPSRFLAKGMATTEGVTVGYSKAGQPAQRYSGGPIGSITAEGKIGVKGGPSGNKANASNSPGDISPAVAKQKSKVKGVEADIPGGPEGQ